MSSDAGAGNDEAEVHAVLAELVGQRIEGADNPYGSIFRLDIGPLARRADDDDDARPHGWRHLTILSLWRLETDREVRCDWNDPGGASGTLSGFIAPLVGLSIRSARAMPPSWDLVLTLSDGSRMVVFSDSSDDGDDAWFILGTDGLELSVSPRIRGEAGGWKLKRGSRASSRG